jgi:hypothetical protein
MKPEQFRSLRTARGPFVSVFLDDARDAADADERVVARCGDIRRRLEDGGADDEVIAVVEAAILHGEPGVGRQGRGIVATRDGVLINEHLRHAPQATVVRISDYPYMLPLEKLRMLRPTYLFAAIDHLGGDIALHQGDVVSSESVDGGGYPVHKPASAGLNGYGDQQHSAEEAVRMNARAVADRLTELVDRTDAQVVFVCGEVRARTDIDSALPSRVRDRVTQLHAGALGHRVREEEISALVDDEFQRRHHVADSELAARFESEIGRHSGLAVEGLEAVCAALLEGAVDTLIVSDLADATVVTGDGRTTVAIDADTLSDLGEAPQRVARADEALPFAAVCGGASLVWLAEGIDPADGVAALLRYAPTDVPDSDPSSPPFTASGIG